MSINELWSVLSHGALVQFDPDAKAEELGPEDYDNIINNAMLVEEYTRQVRNTSCPAARVTHLPEHSLLPVSLFLANLTMRAGFGVVTSWDGCLAVSNQSLILIHPLFARSPLMQWNLNRLRWHYRAPFLMLA